MYLLNSHIHTLQTSIHFNTPFNTQVQFQIGEILDLLWVKSLSSVKLGLYRVLLSNYYFFFILFIFLVISLLIYLSKFITITSLTFWINAFFKINSGNNKTIKDEFVFLLLSLWALMKFFFNYSFGSYFSQKTKDIVCISIPLLTLYLGYICLVFLLGYFLFFILLGYSNKKNFIQKLYADIITVLSFFLRIGIQYIRFIILLVFLTKFYFELFDYFFTLNDISSTTLVYTNSSVFGFAWGKLIFDLLELSFVAIFQMGVFFILFSVVFKSFLLTWGIIKKNE